MFARSGLIVLDLERHQRLVLALRTATATSLILDKSHTTADDVFDAFSLAFLKILTKQKKEKFVAFFILAPI
jgi:hypothetical protein